MMKVSRIMCGFQGKVINVFGYLHFLGEVIAYDIVYLLGKKTFIFEN